MFSEKDFERLLFLYKTDVLVVVMTYQLKNVNYAETQNYVHLKCHRI